MRPSLAKPMTNLELIARLCAMLDEAQRIIREQAALLAMHGIESDTGELEKKRGALLREIEERV